MSAERSTGRLAAVQIAGRVVSLALQVAQFALLARAFGADAFGSFAAGWAIAVVVGSLAEFGIPTIMVLDRAHHDRATVWSTGLVAVICSSVAATLIGVGFGFVTLSGDGRDAALILCGWALFSRVRPVAMAVAQADYEIPRVVAADLAFRVGGTVGAVLAFPVVAESFAGATAVAAAGMVVGDLVGLVIARPGPRVPVSNAQVWSLLRRSRDLGLSAVASATHSRADQVILGSYRVAQGGPYAVAYRLVDAALALVVAAGSVVLPALGRTSGAARASISRALTSAALVFGVGLGATLAIGAPLFVAVIGGSEFESAVPLVRILAVVLVVSVVNMPLAQLVIVEGGAHRLLRISIFSVGLNISLNLLLIPTYGAMGAAIATLATETIGLCLVARVAMSYLPGVLPSRRFWRDPLLLLRSPEELERSAEPAKVGAAG